MLLRVYEAGPGTLGDLRRHSQARGRAASQVGSLFRKEYLDLMTSSQGELAGLPTGSLDGDGAGDHDQPYRFGFRPRAMVPYPFNTRQYARLLIFRSRLMDRLAEVDQDAGTSWPRKAA